MYDYAEKRIKELCVDVEWWCVIIVKLD